MNFRARRQRDEERRREQAVVAMRDSVCRIVAARMPGAGSAALEDAVDAALLRLFARNEHLADLDYVKRGWIIYACQRLLDEQRSAAARRLDPVHVEEHVPALAVSARADANDLSEQERPVWRVPEIFGILHGDERRWAEAWLDKRLRTGKQPRGLDQVLGWTASKTKSVSDRARRKMKAYIQAYANGAVCIEQRARLDTLIDATKGKQLSAELEAVPQLEAVLMHLARCDECRAAWHSRRRAVRDRTALIWLPLGPFADAWDGLHARASGVLHAAHNAAFWIAQRVGISSGDSAGAAAVSGGAVGGKAVAVCVGAVCAAAAAGSGLAGVVQPIIPQAEHRPKRPTTRTAAKPALRAALKVPTAAPRIVTAPPPPPAAASPTRTEAQPDRHFTPGDLPLASTTRTPTASATGSSPRPSRGDFTPGDLEPTRVSSNSTSSSPQPRLRTATSSASRPSCTPGDLGC
ncbi:MAG: hypothetical protein LC790_00025 [Actinobacteria bacterium]|nr:hypothetical protein [Actinomycetota bacterium]